MFFFKQLIFHGQAPKVQKWQGVTKKSPANWTKRTTTKDMQKNKYSNREVAKQKPKHQKMRYINPSLYTVPTVQHLHNSWRGRSNKLPKQNQKDSFVHLLLRHSLGLSTRRRGKKLSLTYSKYKPKKPLWYHPLPPPLPSFDPWKSPRFFPSKSTKLLHAPDESMQAYWKYD